MLLHAPLSLISQRCTSFSARLPRSSIHVSPPTSMEQLSQGAAHGTQAPPPPPPQALKRSLEPHQQDTAHDPQALPPPPPAPTTSTEQHHQAPPLSGPSFLSLPDVAHASIAAFLPDGDSGTVSRLRLSEVSRAQFESYGGSLTRLSLSYVPDSTAARLVALLRRQTRLAYIFTEKQESIPALCEAIVQGCCRWVVCVCGDGTITSH